MGTLKIKHTRRASKETGGLAYCLPLTKFKTFNPSALGLGDISQEGQYFDALAAVFDLEGFTSFSNQIDPHLVIPEYLSEFLNWLFQAISEGILAEKLEDDALLWCPLPFFAKFMGDGVLLLWNTRGVPDDALGNIVVTLDDICTDYADTFLPRIKRRVAKAPLKLRCGIARGQIISIGNKQDFIGPCINVASRLQKIGQFSFAFSKRGFALGPRYFHADVQDVYILISSAIRGIGEEELFFVRKTEFDSMSDAEKQQLLS